MKQPWYAELQGKINQNYGIAQEYYRQREKQFQQVILNDSIDKIKSFENDLIKLATSYKTNVIDQVSNALQQKPTYIRQDNPIYQMSYQKLLSQVLPKNGKGLRFKAGIEFEHFLANGIKLDGDDVSAISKFALQQIGTVVNTAWTTSSQAKDTRTDIAFHGKGMPITKQNQLELTVKLDIDNIAETVPPNLMMFAIEEMIRQQQIDTDVFGFQVKTYQGLSGQKWMNSKQLASIIQSGFDTDNRMWSSNYAPLWAQWILSKYLINIINPVNVGVIWGNGFMYTSQFLEKVRFYVKVIARQTSNQPAAAKRGGGYNIHPALASDEITMYVLNKGSNTIFRTRKNKQGDMIIKIATIQ